VRSNFELALQFNDLILSLNAVLRIQVTFSTNGLVKVLLLLHFSLILHVFLFELSKEILLQLDFFNHLHEVGVGLVSILTVRVTLFFNLTDQAHKLGASCALEVKFLLKCGDKVLLANKVIFVFGVSLFDLCKVLLHHVTLTDKIVDVLLLFLGLLVNPFNFTS
jgi:hypothetical protein